MEFQWKTRRCLLSLRLNATNGKLIISISLTLSELPGFWFRSHYKNRKRGSFVYASDCLSFNCQFFSSVHHFFVCTSHKIRSPKMSLHKNISFQSTIAKTHRELISLESDHRLTLEATAVWIHKFSFRPFKCMTKSLFCFCLDFFFDFLLCVLHTEIARERYKGKRRCVFMYENETINFFSADR